MAYICILFLFLCHFILFIYYALECILGTM